MSAQFVYKIWSGYDQFTPDTIQRRLRKGRLRLGWKRYLDEVDAGTRVYVYFFGQGSFENGVYIDGRIVDVDRSHHRVTIAADRFDPTSPLTDPETSRRIGDLVRPRGRQVFVLPEAFRVPGDVGACSLDGDGASCVQLQCGSCPVWAQLPRIATGDYTWPNRLTPLAKRIDRFVPAYWIIPRRSYIPRNDAKPGIRHTSDLFYALKTGDKSKAYPFALGIETALDPTTGFDCIVPIPLSPDKAKRKEIHRTRLIARHLSTPLNAPVREYLKLTTPLSKRGGRSYTQAQYERAYEGALTVSGGLRRNNTALLVDDVATHGSTLAAAVKAMLKVDPTIRITVTTAGLMVLKETVARQRAVKGRR